jgi:hypothetical protein
MSEDRSWEGNGLAEDDAGGHRPLRIRHNEAVRYGWHPVALVPVLICALCPSGPLLAKLSGSIQEAHDG